MEWLSNNIIKVEPPKKPKKLTGTRFGAVLGQNTWKTDFEVWCEMSRVYEEPFKESIYTLLGKVIEDRQCKYLKKAYYLEQVVKPEDVYGVNFFKTTKGDFYPQEKIFGGMWDALVYKDNKPAAIVECKTTKRAEDWQDKNGNIVVPPYYALQGALYGYLLGLDDVYMIVTIIDEKDKVYIDAQNILQENTADKVEELLDNGTINKQIKFEPSSKNTAVIPFKISEKYPNFSQLIEQAQQWYTDHITSGESPSYDEKRDADILKALRTFNYNPNTDLSALLIEIEDIQTQLDAVYEETKPLEDRLKNLKEQIKTALIEQIDENTDQVVATTDKSVFTLFKNEKKTIDTEKLEKDGLLDNYQINSVSYRLTIKALKEDK